MGEITAGTVLNLADYSTVPMFGVYTESKPVQILHEIASLESQLGDAGTAESRQAARDLLGKRIAELESRVTETAFTESHFRDRAHGAARQLTDSDDDMADEHYQYSARPQSVQRHAEEQAIRSSADRPQLQAVLDLYKDVQREHGSQEGRGVPRGYHRMPSGELMSNHVKHYQPADPRQQVGNGWLGTAGDATLGASTTVGGIAGLSAATGVGVPAAVAEGTLAAGLGATGAVLKGADAIVDAFSGSGSGDCGCHQCEQGTKI
jgi:hypothetical protein